MAKKANTFRVNGKTYFKREITFNAICDLDKMGISISNLKDTPFAAARAYLAICGNLNEDVAGDEIQEHVMGGGDISVILNAFAESLSESGFFRGIEKKPKETKNRAEENPEAEDNTEE